MTTAAHEYNEKYNLAIRQLRDIENSLTKDSNRVYESQKIDWSDVSNLCHVSYLLNEVQNFLIEE